ncbi:PREDICTED: tyrosine-protein kinase Tec-like [Amphimedon queenslandica]|uniref:Tyrosine-protein kinase n=1 Tax=Amphimedon queenslandica TaxID=400682 RepID=A0AAN0JEU4_AMPQE|nr:PREDICTED: tyrosine-protein kinase Tec-like [Amphimedon queenslandica]|eukprot:XP_019855282.1 PREDICTED: tyrosine-protein kinase Tec-like [Amphimedon queenslandica]
MDWVQLEPLLLPDLKETGKELGRGAYGVVTEVIVSGTICAAKKLHDVIVQEYTLTRFGDEVLLHSQQRHPNIVQLIGVYYPPHSQLPMLVMEYLPLSLTQCLEREELPLQMKYSILLDVAKGLCYLHGKRPPIVHRDLTANNVLLTSSYSAKISDLGVSRLADTFKKHHLTTAPGNAMVMPPEALEDNPVYDHKLDVFSYGCLILHVLTGQFPEPTNQFVPKPGKKKSFKKVPEWDRRSNYIKDIPKEKELFPLAKQCLNDVPSDRPEMINSCEFVEQVLSKYPKMKSTIELMKENEAAEKHIRELDAEVKVLKFEKVEIEQLRIDHERLTAEVKHLQSIFLLKENELNHVLQKTVRSKNELKQQEDNIDLLNKGEVDLKEEDLIEVTAMKEVTAIRKHEQQLSECHKESEVRVELAKEQQSKALTVGRKEEFVSSNNVKKVGLESENWFFPTLSRVEAETILKQENKDGTFVVRNSSRENYNTVSLCFKGQVRHYHIKNDEEKKYFISERHRFPTIIELIDYHKLNGGGLATRLKRPPALLVPDQPVLSSAFDDKWQIDKSELSLGDELSSGEFKRVVIGQWCNKVDVAIKMIKEDAMNEDDFIEEAILMMKFQHDNLVKLYGVCIRQGPVYIITELMVNGSLLQYLRKNKHLVDKTDIILDMALQICAAMKFFEQSGFIHRNLAAINCLVGDRNIVKVGGFSSARFVPDDEYTASEGAEFPARWSAPEVITHARYSSKSDIWSYGILLWELWTGGKIPYPAFTTPEILDGVLKGYRLEKPKLCPSNIYDLMTRSWEKNPFKRPSFAVLLDYLKAMVGDDYSDAID